MNTPPAQLPHILRKCCTDADWPPSVDQQESRVLAAAYAHPGTALAHWANGIPVAQAQHLFQDTADLYLQTFPVPDTDAQRDRLRALEALLGYFGRRAITHRPTRVDYERELTQLYAAEFAFLRVRNHSPSIVWTGLERSCPSLHTVIDGTYEMFAANADGCLAGSATEPAPESWVVAIYGHATSHTVALGESQTFPGAYHAARQSLARGDYRD